MRWERIIAAVAALGFAVFSGFVFIGMSDAGDPTIIDSIRLARAG